ncbi:MULTISPECIES: acyl-CoA thioesterase [Nocardia]|uniref:acyl-CoA thioesterase n=1 Tax=Nocardia TaxID=1817 RepID=UPI000D686B32|nr:MULTISPECIES: thioesterase family protein [Nocardia]
MMQLTTSPAAVFELAEAGDQRWRAHVDETWRGWTGPHGGVIAALTIEVARRACGLDLPVRTLDLRFLGRPDDGALTFRAVSRPLGRSTHIVEVLAEQRGASVASASITFGRTGTTRVPDRPGRAAPRVPQAEACQRFRIPAEIVAVGAHFDIRPAAGPLPLTGADDAWMTAWIALTPAMTTDAAALAILADALPPAIFPTLTAPLAVPTVALSLYLHTDFAEPATPTVLVHAANSGTGGGWSVDDTDIWDERGRLLASARQSRRVLG